MSERVNKVVAKIPNYLEIIESTQTLPSNCGVTLYKMYKEIVDLASLIDETDAKDEYYFNIYAQQIYSYSDKDSLLETLKQCQTISRDNREKVIGCLRSLEHLIRTAIS